MIFRLFFEKRFQFACAPVANFPERAWSPANSCASLTKAQFAIEITQCWVRLASIPLAGEICEGDAPGSLDNLCSPKGDGVFGVGRSGARSAEARGRSPSLSIAPFPQGYPRRPV